MSEADPLKGDIPSTDIQPSNLYNTAPSNEGSLSFGETVKTIGKAWSHSVGVKILSLFAIAIVVLFIVFAITMTSFTAINAVCDSDLSSEKGRHQECISRVEAHRAQKNDLLRKQGDVQRDIDALTHGIGDLNKEIGELKRDIGYQKDNITELNAQQVSLSSKKSETQNELDGKKSEKTRREEELTKVRQEQSKANKAVEDEKTTRKYYLIAIGVTGAVNAIDIGLIWYHRKELKKVQDVADAAYVENHGLKGKLQNMNGHITHLNRTVEMIKKQKIETNDSIDVCHKGKEMEQHHLETCIKSEEKVRSMSQVIYTLGLDQAISKSLNALGNTAVEALLLYESKKHGFDVAPFHKALNSTDSLLIIMTSINEYVFGVYISTTFNANHRGYVYDNASFTFTTTRHQVCTVKNPATAFKITDDLFLDIGDGEMRVSKSGSIEASVNVNAGHGYNCHTTSPFEFYEIEGNFKIKDLAVYRMVVKGAKE